MTSPITTCVAWRTSGPSRMGSDAQGKSSEHHTTSRALAVSASASSSNVESS